MQSFCLATLVALIAQTLAFRTRRPRQGGAESNGRVGTVDGLYTFGSPRSASPGLVHPGVDPCFPGLRAWTGKKLFVVTKQADQIPMLPAPAQYKHPMMPVVEFDVSNSEPEAIMHGCTNQSQRWPWYRVGDMFLHARTPYINSAYKVSDFLGNVTDMAAMGSYFQDVEYVAQRVQYFGWRLAAQAIHPGDTVNGGKQVLYLMQRPDSLECLMTFQGTNSVQDIVVDAAAPKAHFCGLVEPDETCGLMDLCQPRKAGGSFVHKGFRDHLRRMIRSEDWQGKIRTALPKCSKVYVGGHSLGGAMSELFTTCVARAPKAGEYGHDEDYQYMWWNQDTPGQLQYL